MCARRSQSGWEFKPGYDNHKEILGEIARAFDAEVNTLLKKVYYRGIKEELIVRLTHGIK